MKIKKRLLIGITFLIVMIAFSIAYLMKGQQSILKMDIGSIDLANTNDGVYTGSFEENRWSNSVKVTVKENKITNIEIVKSPVFKMQDVEDYIISEVIDKQTIQVDSYTGATVSTKAMLKSIENALNNN